MNRLTRLLVATVTATPLLLAGAVAGSPVAGAATVYPPGGPDQTPGSRPSARRTAPRAPTWTA